MKRPKNKQFMPDDEVAEMVSRTMRLFPPNIEGIFRETDIEWAEHQRENEKITVQKAKKEARSRCTRRLFLITHALMIEFCRACKIQPSLSKEGRITRSTANKIITLIPPNINKAPGLSTIEKCFEDPSNVERPGAALRARQLVCWALGDHAQAFIIEDDCVSFRNEQALLSHIGPTLEPSVTFSELADAIYQADLCWRASKAGKK